jgi:glycosyltransferase involved in cell wall biosynthesis
MDILMTARLTIAIPTYNRAELLVRALESALAQTSEEIEILVSDNGSTDNTQAVLKTYHSARLRTIKWDNTVPRAQHGTLIFIEVKTPFVLVLSDDDYIEPEFAHEVLELFDRHPELSFVYTGCIEHYDDQELPSLVGPEIEDSLSFIAAHYANKRQISWCACVTRVADLHRIGPQPDERLIGDMFFWTKIAFLGPVGCVARPLAHYDVLRPSGDNESRTIPIIEWAEDVKRLQNDVMASAKQYGADKNLQTRLALDMHRYFIKSTSNQFIWARISGMRRWDCLKTLPSSFRLGGRIPKNPLRILAALTLSGTILRYLVVSNVQKLALRRKGLQVQSVSYAQIQSLPLN